MSKKLTLFLADRIGVTKETNRTLKKLLDYILTILLVLILVIDWDMTLQNWGF